MGPRCLPLCHYRLLGRDGAVDGWLWGGGGCVVQCANINNGSHEGEETPGVKLSTSPQRYDLLVYDGN
ncbi:Cytochrome P450 monooxygenase patH [Dissostichus eleginoides]|uniref:Cytochrome P450 monooxygenase patH n=1 Tax=Dissostichus eleginoides TaxID=100907 RepID=A0AAD9CGR0_DISEL|nr:Cytochrome P450 monooxygenase patH [Dissostichus eleginoides]